MSWILTEEVVLKTIPAKPHSLVAMTSQSPVLLSTGGNINNVSGQYQDSVWDLMVVQNTIKQRFCMKIYRVFYYYSLSRSLNLSSLSQNSFVSFYFLLPCWENSQIKVWCLRSEGKISRKISPESCDDSHWIFSMVGHRASSRCAELCLWRWKAFLSHRFSWESLTE